MPLKVSGWYLLQEGPFPGQLPFLQGSLQLGQAPVSWLGLPDKAPQTRWFKQWKFIVSPFQQLRVKIKVPVGVVPSESWERKEAPRLSPSLQGFANLCLSLASAFITPVLRLHLHMAFLPMCMSVSKLPLLTRTPVILDSGPTLLQYDLIITNDICMILFPNKVTFWGTGGWDIAAWIWGDTIQPITAADGAQAWFPR